MATTFAQKNRYHEEYWDEAWDTTQEILDELELGTRVVIHFEWDNFGPYFRELFTLTIL